jgi:hypothetical protein
MPLPALFGISVAMSYIAWGAVAWNYLWPALKERSAPAALKPILLLHGFRFVGLSFLVPGVASAGLAGMFARSAAYGDLAAAILALLALATLGSRTGTALAWAFNVWGTVDILSAYYQGSRASLALAPGELGAAYYLVVGLVPLLIITHFLAFRVLLRTKVAVAAQHEIRTAA